MRILGPPSGTRETVLSNLSGLDAAPLFTLQMFPALWSAAVKYSVDAVGVVAQSFKETGGGSFKRLVLPNFYNTAGLKLRHPNASIGTAGEVTLAHSQFVSWPHGAEAHVQHLLAYAGTLDMSGVSYLVVDPRAAFVVGRYRVETFEELGGKWAPSASYGTEIVEIADRLRA
jgi:hypothetical protein